MLRLPVPSNQLTTGCNYAITQVLVATISGLSATLHSSTGNRFKALFKAFYPWSLEPGNIVSPQDVSGL
jgi:hypothetical protein